MAKVILDAGHGGSRDPGAVFEGRQEKDDVLRLALAVGDILEQNGVEVSYTRVNDVYDSPYEKAVIGNNSGADFFISLHRNSNETPNSASGIMTLVYNDEGIKAEMARNINAQLSEVGFKDLGVISRPNLVVLRRTNMPALLVEVGFINNRADNEKFDADFDEIANAIAQGILETINGSKAQENAGLETENIPIRKPGQLYRVQAGAFRNYQNAARYVNRLERDGFPAFMFFRNGLYLVQVGAFREFENAIRMEQRLRKAGYNTFITSAL